MCVGRRKLLYAPYGFVPVENNFNPSWYYIGITPYPHTDYLICSHTVSDMGG